MIKLPDDYFETAFLGVLFPFVFVIFIIAVITAFIPYLLGLATSKMLDWICKNNGGNNA